VDASDEMVAMARERLPDAGQRLLRSEIETLPFDDAQFDVVLSTGALEYTNLGAAIGELARVLRPGGLTVVSYVNRHAAYALWRTRVFYPMVEIAKLVVGQEPRVRPRGRGGLVTAARFRELLAAAGLEPKATVYTSFLVLPSPLDTLLPNLAERLGRSLEGRRSSTTDWLSTQIVFSARKPHAKRR
jgi:SAM-dependent methyltransferase